MATKKTSAERVRHSLTSAEDREEWDQGDEYSAVEARNLPKKAKVTKPKGKKLPSQGNEEFELKDGVARIEEFLAKHENLRFLPELTDPFCRSFNVVRTDLKLPNLNSLTISRIPFFKCDLDSPRTSSPFLQIELKDVSVLFATSQELIQVPLEEFNELNLDSRIVKFIRSRVGGNSLNRILKDFYLGLTKSPLLTLNKYLVSVTDRDIQVAVVFSEKVAEPPHRIFIENDLSDIVLVKSSSFSHEVLTAVLAFLNERDLSIDQYDELLRSFVKTDLKASGTSLDIVVLDEDGKYFNLIEELELKFSKCKLTTGGKNVEYYAINPKDSSERDSEADEETYIQGKFYLVKGTWSVEESKDIIAGIKLQEADVAASTFLHSSREVILPEIEKSKIQIRTYEDLIRKEQKALYRNKRFLDIIDSSSESYIKSLVSKGV